MFDNYCDSILFLHFVWNTGISKFNFHGHLDNFELYIFEHGISLLYIYILFVSQFVLETVKYAQVIFCFI